MLVQGEVSRFFRFMRELFLLRRRDDSGAGYSGRVEGPIAVGVSCACAEAGG